MKLEKSPFHPDVWLLNTDDGKAVGEIRGKKYAEELKAIFAAFDAKAPDKRPDMDAPALAIIKPRLRPNKRLNLQ